mgnify:CR=1 FL=1
MEDYEGKDEIYTIRDFLAKEIDIDVDIGMTTIAYVGPTALTEDGKKEFSEILDEKISVSTYHVVPSLNYASVNYPGTQEKVNLIEKLFCWIAGYCSETDWERLFYYPEDKQ